MPDNLTHAADGPSARAGFSQNQRRSARGLFAADSCVRGPKRSRALPPRGRWRRQPVTRWGVGLGLGGLPGATGLLTAAGFATYGHSSHPPVRRFTNYGISWVRWVRRPCFMPDSQCMVTRRTHRVRVGARWVRRACFLLSGGCDGNNVWSLVAPTIRARSARGCGGLGAEEIIPPQAHGGAMPRSTVASGSGGAGTRPA
jgi:hypothetical protein